LLPQVTKLVTGGGCGKRGVPHAQAVVHRRPVHGTVVRLCGAAQAGLAAAAAGLDSHLPPPSPQRNVAQRNVEPAAGRRGRSETRHLRGPARGHVGRDTTGRTDGSCRWRHG